MHFFSKSYQKKLLMDEKALFLKKPGGKLLRQTMGGEQDQPNYVYCHQRVPVTLPVAFS